MGSSKIKIFKDTILNFLLREEYSLSYVIESADWTIKRIGKYITDNLNKSNLIKSRITTSCFALKNQIVHFGSVHTFIKESGYHKLHKSNKSILTWFHFVSKDQKNKKIIEAQNHIDFIHTASSITKNNLINLGVKSEKIVVIPLGVDLSLFKRVPLSEKQNMRNKLNIPLDKIVIGSFQKDGVGWNEGLKPKLVKGPDILIEVLKQLVKHYPIYILLTGPARGYVKNRLNNLKIPYNSIGYFKNFSEISQYYHALDLYLITSRIEGGPKQILEAWASGVPVVSTEVGMVFDIARNKENILMAEIESIEEIIKNVEKIIEDKILRERLIKNGLEEVKKYSWENITKKYYNDIYIKLI
ncbi:MAG: glycosyltransferase [Candidatus Hodarchaeota archaeon]